MQNQHDRDQIYFKELEKKDDTCKKLIEFERIEKEQCKEALENKEKEAKKYMKLYNTKVQELYTKEATKSK